MPPAPGQPSAFEPSIVTGIKKSGSYPAVILLSFMIAISISRFAMEIFADFGHLQCPPALFHDLRIAHIARNIFDIFGHQGFPNNSTVR